MSLLNECSNLQVTTASGNKLLYVPVCGSSLESDYCTWKLTSAPIKWLWHLGNDWECPGKWLLYLKRISPTCKWLLFTARGCGNLQLTAASNEWLLYVPGKVIKNVTNIYPTWSWKLQANINYILHNTNIYLFFSLLDYTEIIPL